MTQEELSRRYCAEATKLRVQARSLFWRGFHLEGEELFREAKLLNKLAFEPIMRKIIRNYVEGL